MPTAQHRILQALLLGTALWWMLSRANLSSLPFGAIAVAAALEVGRRLAPPPAQHMRWSRLPRFMVFFIAHSLRGGLDVAMRALRPRMGLQPGIVDLPLGTQGDGPRALAALVVCLMPGTLTTRLREQGLRLHVLDRHADVEREVRRIEQEVAALFGEPDHAEGAR